MTPLEREVRALRASNKELHAQLGDREQEIRDLRRQLNVAPATQLMADLRTAIPALQPGDAWLLAALYTANGALVAKAVLIEWLPSKAPDERDGWSVVTTRCTHLRKALGREAIKTHPGVGYSLTPAGLATCLAALQKAPS